MPIVEKFLLGSGTTILSTELNALANNSLALGSGIYDNTIGGSGDGYAMCDLEIAVTFGTAPTVSTGLTLWFIQTQDGTNFEDGSSSVTPAKLPDVVFPVRAVNTAQRIIRRAYMPWGQWRALLKNDGTGQALSASGHTLKIRPVTPEGV